MPTSPFAVLTTRTLADAAVASLGFRPPGMGGIAAAVALLGGIVAARNFRRSR